MYAYDNVRVVWPDGEDSGWVQQSGQDLRFLLKKKSPVRQDQSTRQVWQDQPVSLPKLTKPRTSIAIADLTGYTLSSGELKTLTEVIQETLVNTGYFNVLARSEMSSVLSVQNFNQSDVCDDTECLVELGRILTVEQIVGGSLGKVGETFSFVLRLVSVETGRTEVTIRKQFKGSPDELLNLASTASKELALKYAEKPR